MPVLSTGFSEQQASLLRLPFPSRRERGRGCSPAPDSHPAHFRPHCLCRAFAGHSSLREVGFFLPPPRGTGGDRGQGAWFTPVHPRALPLAPARLRKPSLTPRLSQVLLLSSDMLSPLVYTAAELLAHMRPVEGPGNSAVNKPDKTPCPQVVRPDIK